MGCYHFLSMLSVRGLDKTEILLTEVSKQTLTNKKRHRLLFIVYFSSSEKDRIDDNKKSAGRGSSIGSVSVWHADSPEFDPHVRHILSWRLGQVKNSMAFFPFPLIQEEQLSVTGERMCTKYN